MNFLITKNNLKKIGIDGVPYQNYVKHYSDWKGSLSQFLKLNKVKHEDKLWIFLFVISRSNLPLFAADCAESVLYIFEKKYPTNDEPRKAIKTARLNELTEAAQFKARGAARIATYDATRTSKSYDYARAAAFAARIAICNNPNSLTYPYVLPYINAAYEAAVYALTAKNYCFKEKKKQIKLMIKYAKKVSEVTSQDQQTFKLSFSNVSNDDLLSAKIRPMNDENS
jgi:hypothetical protein